MGTGPVTAECTKILIDYICTARIHLHVAYLSRRSEQIYSACIQVFEMDILDNFCLFLTNQYESLVANENLGQYSW